MESVIWFFCSPKKGFFTLSCPHFCSTLMTFFCWCWKGILFLPCAMRLVLLLPLPFSDCKKTYTRQRMPRLLQSIAKVYLRYLYCPLICGEDKVRSLKETMSIYFLFLLKFLLGHKKYEIQFYYIPTRKFLLIWNADKKYKKAKIQSVQWTKFLKNEWQMLKCTNSRLLLGS